MFQIPKDKLKEILVKEGILSAEVFQDIASEAERLNQPISDILISRGILSLSYYHNLLSDFISMPFADLGNKMIDIGLLNLMPENLARQKGAIIFGREADGALSTALADPTDLVQINFLENYLQAKIKPYIASENDLNKGFSLYGKAAAEDYKGIIEKNIRQSLAGKMSGEKAATEQPIVELIDNIISYAISLRASDIHIEVFQDEVIIRYRIDGILSEVMKIPREVYSAIVARLKLLGGMKIDEHAKPQDGRFRFQLGEQAIDIRVSIIPTFYGEKAEMRLLTAATRPLSFAELGMLPETIRVVEENIKKSYGMFIICGPTGSGKSTTLYAILGILNEPEVNVVTVEDPVEYDIKYVNQTQVNAQAGITFASGLRSILRQDPNIIMVGEIRDNETADISVQAALTGHMVLSSLHTSDAPTAIPRLFDMKIEPFLVSSVLNVVIAQRLVRRLCKTCIYSYGPSNDLIAAIEKNARLSGVGENFRVPKLLYAGKGCNVCAGTGYVGRIGIFEVLNVTEQIRSYLLSADFSLDGLRALARSQGMASMFEDGMKKVELGMTTVEELLRVIRE